MTETSAVPQKVASDREPTNRLAIHGGRRLRGEVLIGGFKHSLVTIVAAAVASNQPMVLKNCPDIEETRVLMAILNHLGASITFRARTLRIDCSGLQPRRLNGDLVNSIHGSVYLVPGFLRRFGRAVLFAGGGCQIGGGEGGNRPTEHYESVLKRFGAAVSTDDVGSVIASAKRLTACDIDLLDYADRTIKSGPLYSGASKMALLVAAHAEGTSNLYNLYPKPDVTDLVTVLRGMGVGVRIIGDQSWAITGVLGPQVTKAVTHDLIPDLIEVVTWITIGALLCDSPLTIRCVGMARAAKALSPELDAINDLGIDVSIAHDRLTVSPILKTKPIRITISSHGIYSDSQPFLALLASTASGTSSIKETVWKSRFDYVDGLAKMGVAAERSDSLLEITGPWEMRNPQTSLTGHDLRSAAVQLIAALRVPGSTELVGASHLARGYEDLVTALVSVGAHIQTIKD